MKSVSLGVCAMLCVLVCAACDSSHSSTTAAARGTPRDRGGASVASSGPAVFAHSCASCHSLVGHESPQKQGGDLLGYHLTRAQLTSFTRVMPAQLTAAQLRAVVDYVYRLEHGRGGLLGVGAGGG